MTSLKDAGWGWRGQRRSQGIGAALVTLNERRHDEVDDSRRTRIELGKFDGGLFFGIENRAGA